MFDDDDEGDEGKGLMGFGGKQEYLDSLSQKKKLVFEFSFEMFTTLGKINKNISEISGKFA